MSERVLLLLPTTSYKATDFLSAAAKLGVEVLVGTDRVQALEQSHPGTTLAFDLRDPGAGLARIRAEHARAPLAAVLGLDDETTVLAAAAAAALGLRHNPLEAVRASRDKHETRRLMAAAGMRTPRFARLELGADPQALAGQLTYPAVLKPLGLSASRGVMRVDGPHEFSVAFLRLREILRDKTVRLKGSDTQHVLAEDYLPGQEVALEGLLVRGRLEPLALFDKPDPLEGPTFEETILVTPSRFEERVQAAIVREAAACCRALGLTEGALHAELRVSQGTPWIVEVAARTIGGLCSRTLRFGSDQTLEELVLAQALGRPLPPLSLARRASGVMMIPLPRGGTFRGARGLAAARAVPHVTDVTLSVRRGAELKPLPEGGDRYVGFIFAEADDPRAVEAALRRAHSQLQLDIA